MIASFCGDMAGDWTATLFLVVDPACLLEGVLMAGSGSGILLGGNLPYDVLVVCCLCGFFVTRKSCFVEGVGDVMLKVAVVDDGVG
jgi:hypothetical protein